MMHEKSNISIVSNIYPVTSEQALQYKNVAKDPDFRKQVRGKAALEKLIKLLGLGVDVSDYDESCKKELLKLEIPKQKIRLYWNLGMPCSRADDGKSHYGFIGNDETERIVCRCKKTLCKYRDDCLKCKLHE